MTKTDHFSIEKPDMLGQAVWIPCTIGNGAFNDEYLVTIQTADGPISGFISPDSVKRKGPSDPHSGFVQGEVLKVGTDRLIIRLLAGSFFTTTGIAYFHPSAISRDTA